MDTDRPPVLGVPFDDVTVEQAVKQIVVWIAGEQSELHQVVTANPEFLVAARHDDRFRQVLFGADLTTADGIGILIGSRILGRPIRNRVTGVDLVEGLASLDDARIRLFLLGAAPGVAARAAESLKQRHPAIRIAGVWEGTPRHEDAMGILSRISTANATVLLVAYGAPQQDIWIAEHRNELAGCGIVVAIGIGGTLDYLAGVVPRAPRWMRRFGLEWLFRLIRQPWRWRRQLALPFFVLLVLANRMRLLRH